MKSISNRLAPHGLALELTLFCAMTLVVLALPVDSMPDPWRFVAQVLNIAVLYQSVVYLWRVAVWASDKLSSGED